MQSRDGFTPVYKVMQEAGPDHDKMFIVGVYVNDELKAKGEGPSKQAAQVTAAAEALRKYTSQ